ncbi:hypothetical protein C4556_03730 [Candidatus Parcubacteria bacterium]|nr:MAG: hypothetical protein C4556_03730 [Candidatus Parcubacteria bacterium]
MFYKEEKRMSDGGIFTERVGGELIRYMGSGLAHDTGREPSQTIGWRERPDGTREEVTFYDGFGWLSKSEHFKLLQEEPRLAP